MDDFDRADASVLGNGWITVAGSLMIQGAQARNAPARVMHTGIQAGLVGATQSVSASFASVDNNLGPLFGLLLRYKDSRNYYWCYRATGGASVVRIARVVNGVETVLKSVGITNPQKEEFFSLDCQARAATLATRLRSAWSGSVSETLAVYPNWISGGTSGFISDAPPSA